MAKKILTIGIPAYNMEKYIKRCLDSVVSGSQIEKLDIIVVNDGSKDSTLEIARKYEEKYPESVRVIDKPNGGWGTAINCTIKEARGLYYKSLDSDDWFDTAYLDKYISLLESLDADMVLTSFNEVNEDGERTGGIEWTEYVNSILPFEDYLQRINTGFRSTIHAVTYRTRLLQDNNITVSERFYGDLDYINSPLVYVESVYLSPLNIYQYFIGRTGQSISVAGYRAHIDDYLDVARKAALFNLNIPTKIGNRVKKYLNEETIVRALWAYKLLMSPAYLGNEAGSAQKLKNFDRFLKENNQNLYKELGKIKIKGCVPYIWLWRTTGLNIFKIAH